MKITKQQLKEIIKEELLKEMNPEHYVGGMDSRPEIEGLKSAEGPPGEHLSWLHKIAAMFTEIDPEAAEQLKLAAGEKEAADAKLDQQLHSLSKRLEKLRS